MYVCMCVLVWGREGGCVDTSTCLSKRGHVLYAFGSIGLFCFFIGLVLNPLHHSPTSTPLLLPDLTSVLP